VNLPARPATPGTSLDQPWLLRRLDVPAGARVLDLGCGWGELLLRAVASGGTSGAVATTGIGADTDDAALARGRKLVADRSLDKQVTFVRREAAAWREPADQREWDDFEATWRGAGRSGYWSIPRTLGRGRSVTNSILCRASVCQRTPPNGFRRCVARQSGGQALDEVRQVAGHPLGLFP
jgi:SAM-dependent methyltransferase